MHTYTGAQGARNCEGLEGHRTFADPHLDRVSIDISVRLKTVTTEPSEYVRKKSLVKKNKQKYKLRQRHKYK